ncbi:MAG: hypothetical protein LBU66_02915, partial [Treponema sp.]|nr:hypothetical protein [Treponema sp.]
EECLRLFSKKDGPALATAVLNGKLDACGGALVVSLIESGLLDRTEAHFAVDNMVSAVSMENDTVYYSEVSYA